MIETHSSVTRARACVRARETGDFVRPRPVRTEGGTRTFARSQSATRRERARVRDANV